MVGWLMVMSTFNTFEDLKVWHESRKLVRAVRTVCKRSNVRKDFAFVDQITRAARSVSANIAEGCDSLTYPDFIKFLGYAKASAAEVRSHLFDALDERYISKNEFDDLSQQTKIINRMISKLIHYLQTLDQKKKRTFSSKKPSTIQPLTNEL